MGLLGRKRDAKFPDLTPVPPMADLPKAKLQSPARYLGTFTEDGEKVAIDPSRVVRQVFAASFHAPDKMALHDAASDKVRSAA